MKNFIEVSEIPEDEEVYLKKDFFGWRVVEPIYLDGKVVWKNVFNKKGFLVLFVLLIVIGLGYLAYQEQLKNYSVMINNPCSFCKDCQQHVKNMLKNISLREEIPLVNPDLLKDGQAS